MRTRLIRAAALAALLMLFGFGPHSTQAKGTWRTMGPMPTARTGLAVGVVHRVVYAVGGYGADGVLNTVEAYDPRTNTWTTKAPMPTARLGLAVGVVNGVLYAVGGRDNPSTSRPANMPTVEAYDPATDTWTTKAPMPTARWGLGVGVLNDILYAVGGGGLEGLDYSVPTVEAYDPATNTWTTKAPMPIALWGGVSVGVMNNLLFVVGAYGPVESPLLAYDPVTDVWTTNTPMPGAPAETPLGPFLFPRWGAAAGVVDNMFYVVGGWYFTRQFSNSFTFPTVESYDPSTDSWTTKAPMPTARSGLGVGVVDNVLYAIGGSDGTGVLATVEAYAHPSVRGITKRHRCDGFLRGSDDGRPLRGQRARC